MHSRITKLELVNDTKKAWFIAFDKRKDAKEKPYDFTALDMDEIVYPYKSITIALPFEKWCDHLEKLHFWVGEYNKSPKKIANKLCLQVMLHLLNSNKVALDGRYVAEHTITKKPGSSSSPEKYAVCYPIECTQPTKLFFKDSYHIRLILKGDKLEKSICCLERLPTYMEYTASYIEYALLGCLKVLQSMSVPDMPADDSTDFANEMLSEYTNPISVRDL